jgi:type IV pilus assembly protein PilW
MTRTRQCGMTLVELLVALAMGLAVTLVVSTLLVAGENHKRTTTSTNDADQTGAYAFHALDRAIRSAGSAIAESAYPTDRGVLGCRLNVNSGILPRSSAFPMPFDTLFLTGTTANLRVSPILIGQGMSDSSTSDVLVVMGGSGAAGGVSRPEYGAGGATSLVLESTVGFNQYDMALVSQPGIADCLLEEVASTSASALTLGTTSPYYYTSTSTSANLATLAASTQSYVTPLGNAAANNVQFQLFGVGTNDTLYSYDLLQNATLVQLAGTDSSQAITDGVVRMNAIYGIESTTAPGTIGTWAGPGDAGYDITTVMTTPATMKTIIAVRVALVVRGEYYDKNTVSPTSLTIFSGYSNTGGTSLSQPVNLSATDQHYRYRVFEFTVPLRNMILLAGA